MGVTEELRRLLDKRGISHIDNEFGTTWLYYTNPHTADESLDGTLIVTGLTAKQAIEATLGRETCRNGGEVYLDFLCSECRFVHFRSDENDDGDGKGWNYCPNCGRKVVAP